MSGAGVGSEAPPPYGDDAARAAVLVNGYATDLLSVQDRGLSYGDGLFETVAVLAGRPLLWERHMRRLAEGCDRLGIARVSAAALAAEGERLCAGAPRCVLKIIVTRGGGGRGYLPPEETDPTRIVAVHPWPHYPAEYAARGALIRLCEMRLARNARLAGLKHLNRLEQVLGRSEWRDPEIAEGLMCDTEGSVIEGTMSNVFAVRDGRLVTPALTHCGVAGVMRAAIMDLAAQLALTVEETSLTVAQIEAADELFLCNSLIGVWPVRRLAETSYRAPGPVTTRLRDALRAASACAPQ